MVYPKKDRIKCTCKECGRDFYVYPYLSDKQKYCSQKCYDKVKSKRMKLLRSLEDKRVVLYCQNCNKPFIVLEGRSKGRKYCSKDCFRESRRQKKEILLPQEDKSTHKEIWRLNY